MIRPDTASTLDRRRTRAAPMDRPGDPVIKEDGPCATEEIPDPSDELVDTLAGVVFADI